MNPDAIKSWLKRKKTSDAIARRFTAALALVGGLLVLFLTFWFTYAIIWFSFQGVAALGALFANQKLRLPHEWRGRVVPAADFPELLVREKWNSRLDQSVISDYHRWLAPLLLLWPRLSPETRRRLELQACENPVWLARVEHLLPPLLEPERVRAALVAARLEAAQGSGAEAFL